MIVLYDDSDGWYDHQMAPVGNASFDAGADRLTGNGRCGIKGMTPQLPGRRRHADRSMDVAGPAPASRSW